MRKAIILMLSLITTLAAFSGAAGETCPEWADIELNGRGFLDEGEYILEDPENGHWMYVNQTLRIQIVRTWETPERIRKSDYLQEFNCFTAEIWCDTEKNELPVTLWADPSKPGSIQTRKPVAQIAMEQPVVFAVSTDLFTARIGKKTEGVVIRNREILFDRKTGYYPGNRPPLETLALYEDGHIESYRTKEKRAEEYLAEGATQVYTFGPALVRDGTVPETIARNEDRNLNPMHAFGMVKPGYYIDVICEGRLRSVNGSTGVLIETLALMMKEKGCVTAVCLDGGDSAVMAFMGIQLNAVPKKPQGRVTCEVLAFGILPQQGAEKDTEKP